MAHFLKKQLWKYEGLVIIIGFFARTLIRGSAENFVIRLLRLLS